MEKQNAKIYATEPDYDLSDYTKAYQWIQKKKTIQVKKVSSFLKLNFVPSAATINISKDIVDEFVRVRNEASWTDFDDLIQSEASMWCIETEDSN